MEQVVAETVITEVDENLASAETIIVGEDKTMKEVNGDDDKKGAGESDTVLGNPIKNESTQEKVESHDMFRLSNNGTLCLEFLEDQGREDNFTDLDLICVDGYIQVHRCLLMGASKFLRDLLIGKDIMDTTAITLPDISVRHLRQVLGILYSGRTVIDGCDEVEVFETMNMLGLPVSQLMCRSAKNNDVEQVAVLRHVSDGDGVCSRELGETEDVETPVDDDVKPKETSDLGKDEKITVVKMMIPENTGEKGESEEEPIENDDNHDEEDHVQQITSTTGDSDSVIDFVPSGQEEGTDKRKQLKETQYKIPEPNGTLQALLDQVENLVPAVPKSDDEGSGKDVIINEESDRDSDVGSVSDGQSQSNNTSHSIISDLQDDLNFEEACNDLQKQVAKPITTAVTVDATPATTTASGYEMKLRKRKTNDNIAEVTKVADEEDKPTQKGIMDEPKTKKKKVPPKTGKKRNSGNGKKTKKDDPESGTDKPVRETRNNRKSKEKSADNESVSSVKTDKSESPSQRRPSNCSSTTDSNGADSIRRVFLEVKELHGVKYNIYGLADPIEGVKSGKRIAIDASKDNQINHATKK